MTKDPIGQEKSFVDGAISMSDIYMKLVPVMNKLEVTENLVRSGLKGVGWANSGGEAYALGKDEYIAVDGIDNVIKVLEALRTSSFRTLSSSRRAHVSAAVSAGRSRSRTDLWRKRRLSSSRNGLRATKWKRNFRVLG